ncbi:putative GCN5-related N-acetyltransferase [Mesorhizobium metallidurans STM 2683]|uniref:Putative GCN5-related N-acetyltransferase n=1 Tax=Mesorhizobium metallidurans STM 2683 TaxID=1297569 RepID=M5FBG4_9HYPH|nr:GNAT family N-acetyltransferase [Mesorhizobium metallidurans]CCV09246.1 putative GCN5-related N-acetyltransferase [Mesorhizobium metallidurans STM 2683]
MRFRKMVPADRPVVESLSVNEFQSAFVEPISETLATTVSQRENYVMDEEGRVVGFFQIDSTSGTQSVDNCLELHEFMIGRSHQGKGYGRRFAEALPEFLKSAYPTWTGVCLTVNCKNAAAKRLYELAGFVETGNVKAEGGSGPQFIMCRVI